MALKKIARTVQMDRDAILADDSAAGEAAVVAERPAESLQLATPPAALKRSATRRTKPTVTAEQEEGGVGARGGNAITLLLTEDQWEWVRSEADRRKIAQRYVLLSAVERHHDAIADHFRTTVAEGETLFRWRGEPKDVDGRKVGSPVRIPAAERQVLQRLVDESTAPSLSFYLRVAADLARRESEPTTKVK